MTSATRPGRTGICVRADLLAMLVSFPSRPYVGIDGGEPDQILRHTEFFPVEPGWHAVRCFIHPPNFPAFLRFGDSTVKILVPRGCVVSLRWKGPGSFLGRGQFRFIHAE